MKCRYCGKDGTEGVCDKCYAKEQEDSWYSNNEKKLREIKMYGCTREDLDTPPLFPVRKRMRIMQILSDAQEEIARGNSEIARQFINRAKYFLMGIEDNS